MDHLMNMGKKILKNSMNGNSHHQNNGDYTNYNQQPGYNMDPGNAFQNYGPMGLGQQNYGASGYGPQGFMPQSYEHGYGGYGPPPGPGYAPGFPPTSGYGPPSGLGYAPGVPPTSGYGHPPQGNHGHSMNILKVFDRDGDGNITENDFVIAARQIGLGFLGESIARSTFRKFDKNRNGRLEISEALGAIGTMKGMGGHKHY